MIYGLDSVTFEVSYVDVTFKAEEDGHSSQCSSLTSDCRRLFKLWSDVNIVIWSIDALDSVISEVSFVDIIFIIKENGEVGDEVDWEVIIEGYFSFPSDYHNIEWLVGWLIDIWFRLSHI